MPELRRWTKNRLVTVLLFNMLVWMASLYHLLSFSHRKVVTAPRAVTSHEQLQVPHGVQQMYIQGNGTRQVGGDALAPITGPPTRPITPPSRRVLRFLENRNEERKSALKRTCRQYDDRIPHLTNSTVEAFAKFVIVDKSQKVMYCPIPKVACTTWVTFFLKLNGVHVSSDVHSLERNGLVHLEDLAPEERETVLRNYTKLLIVRHPFTRLLSAFRDKLEPNGSFETTHANHSRSQYYHKHFWRERMGLRIIATYRGIAAAEQFALTRQDEYDLTFREFTDYIVDFKDRGNTSTHRSTRDRHWREMVSLCYPCDVEYDYIAKFETLEDDSKHFLVRSGISNTMAANYGGHRTNSSESTVLSQFYDKLSVESIKKIYSRYEMDFKLFGYSPDIVLE